MLSCAIPRKIYITKKPLSPVLPEFSAVVKPQTEVMSKEKLARKLAKYHRQTKFNLNTCKQKLEVKKLKEALEARKGKTAKFPIELFKKPKHVQSVEKQVKMKISYFPKPEKVKKVVDQLKMNPNHYWSARDARNGLIIPSHLFGKLKKQFK